VRGASALEAGLLVVPQGVGIMAVIPISGRLVDRGHARRLVLVGLGVDIAAVAVLTGLTASTPYWLLAVALFVLGVGMGMVGMPNMSIAQKTLRPPEIARGSTSLSIIQQCGAAIGTATLSVILSHEVAARVVGGQAPPPAVLADAYASSFRWALVLLVLALVSTLFLPRTRTGS